VKRDEETIDFHRSTPELDECRFLIKKVIEQAVRDFAALENATSSSEQSDYQTACGFLFDDEYQIDWGGLEMSLQDLLDWVDLEAEWVRKKAILAKERRKQKVFLKQEAKRREHEQSREGSVSRRVNGVQR
jgi:hypothetical protein